MYNIIYSIIIQILYPHVQAGLYTVYILYIIYLCIVILGATIRVSENHMIGK